MANILQAIGIFSKARKVEKLVADATATVAAIKKLIDDHSMLVALENNPDLKKHLAEIRACIKDVEADIARF